MRLVPYIVSGQPLNSELLLFLISNPCRYYLLLVLYNNVPIVNLRMSLDPLSK